MGGGSSKKGATYKQTAPETLLPPPEVVKHPARGWETSGPSVKGGYRRSATHPVATVSAGAEDEAEVSAQPVRVHAAARGAGGNSSHGGTSSVDLPSDAVSALAACKAAREGRLGGSPADAGQASGHAAAEKLRHPLTVWGGKGGAPVATDLVGAADGRANGSGSPGGSIGGASGKLQARGGGHVAVAPRSLRGLGGGAADPVATGGAGGRQQEAAAAPSSPGGAGRRKRNAGPSFPVVDVGMGSRKVLFHWVRIARKRVHAKKERSRAAAEAAQKANQKRLRRARQRARVDRVVKLYLDNQEELERLCLREPGMLLNAQLELLDRRLELLGEDVRELGTAARPAPGSSFAQEVERSKIPEAPMLRPGVAVYVEGLKSAKELNGKEGVLEFWDEAAGRWIVRLANGDIKKLKPENLKVDEAKVRRGIGFVIEQSFEERFDEAFSKRGQWKRRRDEVQQEAEEATAKRWLAKRRAEPKEIVLKIDLVAQMKAERERVAELVKFYEAKMRRLREKEVVNRGEAAREEEMQVEMTMAQALREQRQREEEDRRRQAELEEARRRRAEEEEKRRLEEDLRRIEQQRLESERLRREREEAERKRLEEERRAAIEAEERRRREAEEARRRQEEEERLRREAEEAERLRREQEERRRREEEQAKEQRRLEEEARRALEAERQRIAEEAERARLEQEEAERLRKLEEQRREEEERRRRQEEEERRKRLEEEERRRKEEEEARRRWEEEERLRKEEEEKKLLAELEAVLAREEEERFRREQEAEAAREAEIRRLEEELKRKHAEDLQQRQAQTEKKLKVARRRAWMDSAFAQAILAHDVSR